MPRPHEVVRAAASRFLRARQPPVVATRLCGGLGNQLFQFAAGRSLAARCGAQLILDATAFGLPTERRKFELGAYPIIAKVASDGYAYPPTRALVTLPRGNGLGPRLDGLMDRIADRIRQRGGAVEAAVTAVVAGARRATGQSRALRVFREKAFDYDPAFETLGPHTYLDGYWQSERYFNDVRQLICREIRLPYEPNSANACWLGRIRSTNSVCVHVRRGDYLMTDHFGHHGVCSADYYRRAMRLLLQRVDGPQFFVFSDDLDWSRRHFAGENVAFVDSNSGDAAQDELKLMASCRHHIIANSSLSWWGAWLAANDDQIVIGPDPWFSARKETPDLFPANWLALPRA
jgi:hypothetical protein